MDRGQDEFSKQCNKYIIKPISKRQCQEVFSFSYTPPTPTLLQANLHAGHTFYLGNLWQDPHTCLSDDLHGNLWAKKFWVPTKVEFGAILQTLSKKFQVPTDLKINNSVGTWNLSDWTCWPESTFAGIQNFLGLTCNEALCPPPFKTDSYKNNLVGSIDLWVVCHMPTVLQLALKK